MPQKTANLVAFLLILASFGCLVPGLILPALTLDMSPTLPFLGKVTLYHQTRSILGTVKNLYDTKDFLVSFLILLFSVIVPFAKGLALLAVLALGAKAGTAGSSWRGRILGFVGLIGKWSMADVFVMGIFLAYLAGGAAQGVTALLHNGFWWFQGYCLLSVLSTQFIRLPEGRSQGGFGSRH